MSKALGFLKNQLNVDFRAPLYGVSANPDQIFKFNYELLTRPECETMEDYMHLIPYITLVNVQTGEVFVYSRGKGGGESRLHGNCSIGLGGHMEDPVTATYSIQDAIVDTIAKELEEEVGLPNTPERKDLYRSKLDTNNFNIILDTTNDVGKVHLGIAMFVVVDPKELGAVEQGVIERGQWMSIQDLIESHEAKTITLENWSVIVLGVVNSYLSDKLLETA